MSDTEQDLGCLHADVVAVLFRIELKIGVCEQQARSTTKVSKMQDTVVKREAQSAIFGVSRGKRARNHEGRLGRRCRGSEHAICWRVGQRRRPARERRAGSHTLLGRMMAEGNWGRTRRVCKRPPLVYNLPPLT